MAKTYIDWTSCKEVSGQFWSFHNISLNLEKLKQYANEKGYVNITMSKRKEVWQYWDTHYCTLNEWKPEESKEPKKTGLQEIDINDLPF